MSTSSGSTARFGLISTRLAVFAAMYSDYLTARTCQGQGLSKPLEPARRINKCVCSCVADQLVAHGPRAFCGDLRPFADVETTSRAHRGRPTYFTGAGLNRYSCGAPRNSNCRRSPSLSTPIRSETFPCSPAKLMVRCSSMVFSSSLIFLADSSLI